MKTTPRARLLLLAAALGLAAGAAARANDIVQPRRGAAEGAGVIAEESFREVLYVIELSGGGKQNKKFFTPSIARIQYADVPDGFRAGEEDLRKENFPEAAASFAAAFDQCPQPFHKAAALFLRGKAARLAGDHDQAIEALERYLKEYRDGRHRFDAVEELMRAYGGADRGADVEKIMEEWRTPLKDFRIEVVTEPEKKALAEALIDRLQKAQAESYLAMPTPDYARAADLLRRQYQDLVARDQQQAAVQVLFEIGDMWARAGNYDKARFEYANVARYFSARNDGRFQRDSSLLSGRSEVVGRALLKLGDTWRHEAETTGDVTKYREAVPHYAYVTTFIKFLDEPDRHAEALYKLARTYQDIAEREHGDAKNAADPEDPSNPYYTWSKQAGYVADELTQFFPESRWTQKWLGADSGDGK